MVSSKEQKKKRDRSSAAAAAAAEIEDPKPGATPAECAAAASSPPRKNNDETSTSPERDDDSNDADTKASERSPSSARDDSEAEASASDDDDNDDDSTETNDPAPSSSSAPLPQTVKTTPANTQNANPPLPNEPVPGTAATANQDDGWTCQWDPTHQAWYFYNIHTGMTTWENPRVPTASSADSQTQSAAAASAPLPKGKPIAGGYNPAIHGDYDPTAWYAQQGNGEEAEEAADGEYDDGSGGAGVAVGFNRWTGAFTAPGEGAERHSDESKARRQMNAFFDVDAAANAHDGRSLRAERAGKRLTKAELKQFKEKRKAKKEEKRRAWLRD